MINSWSLLYDEIYGDDEMTEDNRITSLESDEYDPKPESTFVTSLESDEYDPIITTGTGNTAVYTVTTPDIEHSDAWYDYKRNDPDRENPFTDPVDRARADFVVGLSTDFNVGLSTDSADYNFIAEPPNYESITIDTSNWDTLYAGDCIGDSFGGDAPSAFSTLADNDDSIAHHVTTPGIKNPCNRKYKEDESIKALQDYISTTYGGHYTSDTNDVQTLDLIESVGDAESFCRSNAIKYLSRYDKKGQAKRDILKALHYSLLLYHFSGQLNETPTRGYETF